MKVKVICDYCGFNEIRHLYGTPDKAYVSCSKCKDKNVKYKEIDTIDTYEGSPAFPERKYE